MDGVIWNHIRAEKEVANMMKCRSCGTNLKCTMTMDDIIVENQIIRRKICPECGMVYLTKEEIFSQRPKKEVANNGKESENRI